MTLALPPIPLLCVLTFLNVAGMALQLALRTVLPVTGFFVVTEVGLPCCSSEEPGLPGRHRGT